MATNYTDYIANIDFTANITKNIADIAEYNKALQGERSTVLKTANPSLGKIYFQSTGEPCNKNTDQFKKYIADMSNSRVPWWISQNDTSLPFSTYKNYFTNSVKPTRYSVSDAYNFGYSIYDSANADLSKITDPNVEASKPEQNSCVPVTLQVMDTNGFRKLETQFVTVADLEKIPYSRYLGGINPVKDKPPVNEGFADINAVYAKMDAGQKVFVGSLGVLGLYFLFKLMYKPLGGR
jgi:hypothetical protein